MALKSLNRARMKNLLLGLTLSISILIQAEARIPMEIEGHSTRFDGPNCWNLAMVSAGFNSHFRNTDATEAKFYLTSLFCRSISESEKSFGDIGVIKDAKNDQWIHGFVVLDSNQVFSKNGGDFSIAYKVQDLDFMLSFYKVSQNELTTSYYRCSSPWPPQNPLHQESLVIEKAIEDRVMRDVLIPRQIMIRLLRYGESLKNTPATLESQALKLGFRSVFQQLDLLSRSREWSRYNELNPPEDIKEFYNKLSDMNRDLFQRL